MPSTRFASPAELAKIKKRRETSVQTAILEYLALRRDVTAWRANSRVVAVEEKGRKRLIRYGVKGQPDILGWVRTELSVPRVRYWPCSNRLVIARPLGIEVKARGKKPTPEQTSFLQRLREDGGIAIAAWSVDDVIAGLEAADLKALFAKAMA